MMTDWTDISTDPSAITRRADLFCLLALVICVLATRKWNVRHYAIFLSAGAAQLHHWTICPVPDDFQ